MSNSPAYTPARHPVRGALFLVFAMLLLACADATTKYLAARYDVPMIVASRFIVNLLLMILLLGPTQGRQLVATQRTGLVVVRSASLAAVALFASLALQRMPVAETTAMGFLSPILVVLLAGPLLGERSGAFAWAAAAMGFIGMLLIVRPGSGLNAAGVGFVLAAIGSNVCYQLLSRVLAASERTLALLFHSALFGSIGFGLALPWFWNGDIPDLREAVLFLSLGVYGGLGHFLVTAAFREAPASTLAPLNFVQLLWAGLLGWLVFDHVPDRLSLLGMCIVAGSGAMIALKSTRLGGRPEPVPLNAE